MFDKLFNRKAKAPVDKYQGTPTIMGLRLTGSFEVDTLWLNLLTPYLQAKQIPPTQIITAVGVVDLDGTQLFRFYTDDEAWLQVVAERDSEESVVDVTLFHYYDTLDVANKTEWDMLLKQKIGAQSYHLNGQDYQRVWTTEGAYHSPVHMREVTCEDNTASSTTDQFTMLFEREIGSEGDTEMLFVSAEEVEVDGNLERCLVLSTGIKLSPSQLTMHG